MFANLQLIFNNKPYAKSSGNRLRWPKFLPYTADLFKQSLTAIKGRIMF